MIAGYGPFRLFVLEVCSVARPIAMRRLVGVSARSLGIDDKFQFVLPRLLPALLSFLESAVSVVPLCVALYPQSSLSQFALLSGLMLHGDGIPRHPEIRAWANKLEAGALVGVDCGHIHHIIDNTLLIL